MLLRWLTIVVVAFGALSGLTVLTGSAGLVWLLFGAGAGLAAAAVVAVIVFGAWWIYLEQL